MESRADHVHFGLGLGLHQVVVTDEWCANQGIGRLDGAEPLAVRTSHRLPVLDVAHVDARADDVGEEAPSDGNAPSILSTTQWVCAARSVPPITRSPTVAEGGGT